LNAANLKQSLASASKVCISVYGRSLKDLKDRISQARAFSPAFLELRLDYLKDPSEITEISKSLSGKEIFTLRSRSEGGAARISEKSRIEILRNIISLVGPPYVDIEISALDSWPDLAKDAELAGSKLICSSHDFQSLESLARLRNLVDKTCKIHNPFAVKIVRNANSFNDNKRILSLYRISEKISPTKLIAFCAGPLGILSRISCVGLGSPFTYASLPEAKTAPGQLEVLTMQSLIEKW
jgi:3-dehydroquinate dehydratase type I